LGYPARHVLNRDALARWLWHPTNFGARLARAPLLPLAGAYAAWMSARARVYAGGLVRPRDPGIPVIAVGNLSVGGTGKTPLASWIAARCLALGARPGIVLRGYGRDETTVHCERLPEAIVVAGRDRYRAVRQAASLGARVAILDDGFQRLDVERQLNVLLVSAESAAAPPWPLPAGPWRESWQAARRADVLVVTRKRAGRAEVGRVLRRLAALGLGGTPLAVAGLRLAGLTDVRTGRAVPLAVLRGARVLAACGIADPESFAHQLAGCGAMVRLASWPDHHAFGARDLARLLALGRDAKYVVVTHKDAVKLAGRWPRGGPAALTAHLTVTWHAGGDLLPRRIAGLLTGYSGPAMYSTPHADRTTA
jgi:tetraacyldisaccharide 4'-kinase